MQTVVSLNVLLLLENDPDVQTLFFINNLLNVKHEMPYALRLHHVRIRFRPVRFILFAQFRVSQFATGDLLDNVVLLLLHLIW